MSLIPGARTIFHMIPLSSFNSGVRYDLTELETRHRALTLPPSSDGNIIGFCQYNLEGMFSSSERTSQRTNTGSYLQIYRTGILEGVEAESINWPPSPSNWSILNEQRLIASIDRGKSLIRHLGIEPPTVLFVTLVGVKNHALAIPQGTWNAGGVLFDREVLLLPDVLIDSFDTPADEIVRPILDAIWNAGGYPKCLNYDENGQYKVPK